MDTLDHLANDLGPRADQYALHNESDGTRTTLRELYYALDPYYSRRARSAMRDLRNLSHYGTRYPEQDYGILTHAANVLRALRGAA